MPGPQGVVTCEAAADRVSVVDLPGPPRRPTRSVSKPRPTKHSPVLAIPSPSLTPRALAREDKMRTLIIYDPARCPPDMGLDAAARSPRARILGARALGASPAGSRHGSITVRCVARSRSTAGRALSAARSVARLARAGLPERRFAGAGLPTKRVRRRREEFRGA